jgi:flavin-binding protein dodecin
LVLVFEVAIKGSHSAPRVSPKRVALFCAELKTSHARGEIPTLLYSEPLNIKRGYIMKNHVYKILEIVGSSETSIEEAISTAIAHASKTVRNMDWFEVVQTRGHIENGKIGHYQVTLKIGFTLES